jgi:hypothetical protein
MIDILSLTNGKTENTKQTLLYSFSSSLTNSDLLRFATSASTRGRGCLQLANEAKTTYTIDKLQLTGRTSG